MAINPHGMPSVTAWADATVLTIGDAWAFERLDDPERWRDWAVAFTRASPFAQQNPPDPYQFTDWRDYASRLYVFLERAGA